MKNKTPALLWMLVATAVLIAAAGAYLKYAVLRPLELYQDEPVFAVPFLLMAREEDRALLRSPSPEETLPEPTAPPETQLPETEPPVTETEIPATEPPTEPAVIDESWFDDALFIGDSRTEGLSVYARLGKADYFCKVGMTVYNVQTSRCSDADFGKMDLASLLDTNSYGKIYISLGLNEIGYSRDNMLEKYRELIDLIREKQPDTVIVLQGIMTLGRRKAASREYFSLENVHKLNSEIAELADGEQMRYIDVNEWIADEEGYLPEAMSEDGCHLYGSEYGGWAQWLMDNAATLGIE